MLGWVRDNPLCPHLLIFLIIVFSPVKSILHAYVIYNEGADRAQEYAHKEKKKQ